MKNVKKVYEGIKVMCSAQILYNKNSLNIYEIIPINIIEKSSEIKEKVYNVYFSTVKAMPHYFQVLILKEKWNIEEKILNIQKRAQKIQANTLRNAMLTYSKNLEKLSQETNRKTLKFYLVTSSNADVELIFKNLVELGLKIKRIDNKGVLNEIIKQCGLKEVK